MQTINPWTAPIKDVMGALLDQSNDDDYPMSEDNYRQRLASEIAEGYHQQAHGINLDHLNARLVGVREACVNYMLAILRQQHGSMVRLDAEHQPLLAHIHTNQRTEKLYVQLNPEQEEDPDCWPASITEVNLIVWHGDAFLHGHELSTDDLLVLADAVYRQVND